MDDVSSVAMVAGVHALRAFRGRALRVIVRGTMGPRHLGYKVQHTDLGASHVGPLGLNVVVIILARHCP